jgi:hypothetical protein
MAEGGFDIAAYRREKAGGDPDRGLLVTFRYEAVKQSDGSYDNVEYLNVFISNIDQIDRPVTPADRVRFKTRYDAFKAGEVEPQEGMPIKMCAFATPANVAACKSEKIYTVEQLVETPDERLIRAQLITFKYMCSDWLKSSKNAGYMGQMREQIETLKLQVEALKNRLADRGESVETPKRRGRPPKVKDEDASDAA